MVPEREKQPKGTSVPDKTRTFIEDLHWAWKHIGAFAVVCVLGGVAWAQLDNRIKENSQDIVEEKAATQEVAKKLENQGRKIERIDERTKLILERQNEVQRTLRQLLQQQ